MKSYLKTIVSTILVYLMILSMLPMSVLSVGAEDSILAGDGTADSPYLITNADEFAYAMNTYSSDTEVYLSLENDIDISGLYQPVADFKAHFNGNYHTVTAITSFANKNTGIVSALTYQNNRVFETPDSEMYYRFNGFVYTNAGLLSGVFVHANVTGAEGAIVCNVNNGNIWNCAAFGSVDTYNYDGADAAGIAVNSNGDISNCYVVATIKASGSSRYGVSRSHPITFGSYENTFFDATVCSLDYSDGYSSDFMKSEDFISLLNKDVKALDSLWTLDSDEINGGYPVLKSAYNAQIKCSKNNSLIYGLETVELYDDDGSDIYYTIDGSEPDLNSTLYSGPIEISDTVTIKVKGYKNGLSGNSVQFAFAKVEGNGTNESPYIIDCEAALLSIPELSLSSCYELSADIELTKEFLTLGDFYGSINGNNHTISSVWSKTYQNGLFKCNYGLIQNLNLSNSNQNFKSNGAFAYQNYGVISNCTFNGLVTGYVLSSGGYSYYRNKNGGYNYALGGFVSFNYGTISNSRFVGNLDVKEGNTIGGFVGVNDATVTNCLFEGDIYVDDLHFFSSSVSTNLIGGFIGYNSPNGTIDCSTAETDSIYVRTSSYAGGTAYTFGSLAGSQTECSCHNGIIVFYANYLEWGGRDTVAQSLDGSGYTEEIHKHHYQLTSVLPTCTEDGTAEYVCSDCGDSIEGKDIPKLGHDFVATIVSPTYEDQGYTEHVCSRCGESYRDTYVEEYKTISGSCGENCTYSMDTGIGTMIISGSGSMADYAKISNYSTDTNTPWYAYRNRIKRIVISDGVTSVGDYAFYNCPNIANVDLGSVARIGQSSFMKTANSSEAPLTEISLPVSLKTIDSGAFFNCYSLNKLNYQGTINDWIGISFVNGSSNPMYYTHNLYLAGEAVTNVNISAPVTEIKPYAFFGFSGMKSLLLPDTVASIGIGAFYQCRGLESITMPCSAVIEPGTSNDENFDLCDKISKVTLTKGNGTMVNNSQSPWHDGKSSLTEVVLSDGIESICDNAFKDCINLEFVTFPNNPYTLGGGALSNTLWMKNHAVNGLYIVGNSLIDGSLATGEVVIPGSVTEIKKNAFSNNGSITSLTIPDSVTNIEEGAFYNCYRLKELTVPCSSDIYHDGVFTNTKYLEKLTMTKGTGTMISFATDSRYLYTPWYLSASTLTTVVLEEGITNIGRCAFYNLTKLKNLYLPSTLKVIDNSSFSGDSSLSTLVLPDGFERVGAAAFRDCTGLKEITLPCSADTGSYLTNFENCTNIEKITMTKGTGVMGSFNGKYNCTPWYISRAKLKEFILEDGITNIGSYMFYGNTSFSGFEIPDSVKSIGANAFYNCTNLKDIDLPDSLENIYGYAFYKCTGLTNLSFPTSLKKINDYAYSNCSNISSISFNDGLTEIQAYAFQSCTALDKVTLPESIEKMGNGVFAGCNNLSKVYILSRNCTISKNTFPTTTTIFGYAGSSAQTYAQNNSRAFAELYGKCSECDAWITDRVITPPTCTEKGYSTYTCDACGHTYVSDEVDATGHDWAEGKITFSADGKTATAARICKHDAAYVETVDCTVTSQVAKPSTCTASGDTTYTAVAVFSDGARVSDTKTVTDISAIGHNWADGTVTFSVDGKTATATRVCRNDPDHTETVSCTVTSSVTKAATCTENGQTTYTAKGVFSTEDQVIDTKVVSDIGALGHDWETGIITFSPDGKTANAFRVCKRDHDHTETAACSVTKEVEKPATCTEDGKTKYAAFAVFSDGTEISASLILTDIKATGHSWDAGTVTKSPTCKEVGKLTFTCKHDSSHTYSVDIPIIPHNYSSSVTAPTCTEKGYTTHTCLMCGDSYIDSYTDALKHDWDEGKVTKEPTCTEQGVKTYTCKHDNTHTYTEPIKALGHDYESVVTPPTCTERGYTTHTCSRCKDSYVDTYVKVLGHDWDDGTVTKEPTCTEQGVRTYTCKHDNSHTYTEPINAHGHSYESVVTPPSCTEKGFTTHTCTVCKHSFKDTYVDALDHDWDEGKITKAPTCTETGTKTFTCKHDASHTYSIVVEQLGHRYESVTAPPSCTAGGYTTYTCSVCKDTYTDDYTEMLEHSYHSVVTPPSCTEGGYTTYTCTACHDSYVSDYTKALGHTWNEGVITTKPDCENPGVKTYTCTVCGETRDETVDASGHKWNAGVVTKEPTYHTTGEKVYTCSVCGGTKTEILSCLEKRGKFVISDETVRAGDEVKVKIYIDKNPGITGLSIDVDYPEELTLTEIKYADLLSAKPTNSKDYNSPMTISWHSPGSLDEDATGLFATLTFVADINAEATDYTVRVTYKADNIIDSTLEDIPFDVENGTVSVQRPTPGDVNRDGAINMKDLVLVQQYINHWDISIVERAADVNDDDDINMKDLVILQQYINGWEVELK